MLTSVPRFTTIPSRFLRHVQLCQNGSPGRLRAPTHARRFWSWRKVDPDFEFSFIDEIINHSGWDGLDWLAPSLGPRLKKYCEDLGLWDEEKSCLDPHWHVEVKTYKSLPPRLPHAGRYEWVGGESFETPKWLWDTKTGQTVRATKSILREGYTAVSYTWGRFRKGNEMRAIEGVPWKVPAIDHTIPGSCDIVDLLPILTKIPGSRYYWVDVLCIDQEIKMEGEKEIAKQGAIFAQAKGVYIWLTSVPNGHQLARALCHLGDSVLRPLRITDDSDLRNKKCRATYHRRDEEDRAKESLAAWRRVARLDFLDPSTRALQNDPWFTSLWTMQEMVMCPSGVLMAKNGQCCTVNGQVMTVAKLAAAIDLGSSIVLFRRLMRAYDQFLPYGQRAMLQVTSAFGLEDEGSAWGRGLDAIAVLRKRTFLEMAIVGGNSIWASWAATTCLNISLTADRSDILAAATKRESTKRRGAAIIAAMKIAPFEGALGSDEKSPLPSQLPIALLNKVLEAEGRALFHHFHSRDNYIVRQGKPPLKLKLQFFSHLTPQASDDSVRTIFSDFGEYSYIPCPGWFARQDGTLHLPSGSELQVFDSGTRKVELIIHGATTNMKVSGGDMTGALRGVSKSYAKWLRMLQWTESLSRAYGPPEMYMAPSYDHVQEEHEDLPAEIEVRFLPLALMLEPNETKQLSLEAKENPVLKLSWKLMGLSTETDDRVAGIIIASDKRSVGQRVWYKCGMYLSYGSFTPFPIPEKEGLTIGKL